MRARGIEGRGPDGCRRRAVLRPWVQSRGQGAGKGRKRGRGVDRGAGRSAGQGLGRIADRASSRGLGRIAGRIADRSAGRGSDRGVATVWVAVTAAGLCTVFAVVLALGQVVAARHRAGGAADLAALAAADRALEGAVVACEAARRVALAQGAVLVRCAVHGDIADVTARYGFGPHEPAVRARAGPPVDSRGGFPTAPRAMGSDRGAGVRWAVEGTTAGPGRSTGPSLSWWARAPVLGPRGIIGKREDATDLDRGGRPAGRAGGMLDITSARG